MYVRTYRRKPVRDVIFSSISVKIVALQREVAKNVAIIAVKQVRQEVDLDLFSSERTKCQMSQSNNTKVKYAYCLILFVGNALHQYATLAVYLKVDFDEGVN